MNFNLSNRELNLIYRGIYFWIENHEDGDATYCDYAKLFEKIGKIQYVSKIEGTQEETQKEIDDYFSDSKAKAEAIIKMLLKRDCEPSVVINIQNLNVGTSETISECMNSVD
jgi:hypothetical protein